MGSLLTLGEKCVQVGVQDELSGLVMASVEYALSIDEGRGWGLWESSPCSGSEGSTERQIITLLSHLSGRAIRLRVMDRAGNWSISPLYGVPSAVGG